MWACFLTEWVGVSCAVYQWTAEGAYIFVLMLGLMVWHKVWLTFLGPCHWGFGSGWHWAGGGKKNPITPTLCPYKNESKLENNMQGSPNTGTLTICWCFLLHTVFAKLPLTACISNETLCPCGEGSKSVPVRTGTISPVWLLWDFFFLIHVLMNKWSPWSHFFHICVNCFKSILSCHKKAQLICWA